MPAKLSVLIAGIFSGGVFLAIASAGLGFFFLFLPTLPLFSLGLGKQPRMALYASVIAALVITLFTSPQVGLLFFLMLGVPVWYIAQQALLWREREGVRQWYPLGLVFSHLTFYGCALCALLIVYYSGEEGGLPGLLARNLHEAFTGLDADYREAVEILARSWLFVVFPITLWLWNLALYAHAWFAQRMLARRSVNIRPDFAIGVFAMPHIMLAALALSAGASLTGEPSLVFFGKSMLISLLLPYFYLGAALMHRATISWPNRRFFLFFVYFMVFAQFWPALILSGVGIWHHIKRLSTAPGSSSN